MRHHEGSRLLGTVGFDQLPGETRRSTCATLHAKGPQIDPETRPSNIAPPFTGHFKITADTPRGLQPHQPAPGSTVTAGKPHAGTERLANAAPPSKSDLNLEVRRNIYEASGKEVTPGKTEDGKSNGEANGNLEDALKKESNAYYCNSCGKDCTRVRYHNSKALPVSVPGKTATAQGKYDICPQCFSDGRFPSSASPAEYTKLENDKYTSIADRDAPWSDSELLLLLEGLEMFDENWDSVAGHVGTRTREECVLKFLQLEIEDRYLDGEPDAKSGQTDNLAYLTRGRVPFSQAENPVMSVVGFLAGLADPGVTAAAAGRTVDEMKKHIRGKLAKDSEADADQTRDKGKEPEGAAETVKDESQMDVDRDSTALVTTGNDDRTTDPATLALSLTAARSSALASHTERHITALVSQSVNLQLQKLEIKLAQFAEMESLLAAERRDLDRQRQRLFLDRLAFRKRVAAVEDKFRQLGVNVQGSADQEGDGSERLGFKIAGDEGEGGDAKPPTAEEEGVKTHEI